MVTHFKPPPAKSRVRAIKPITWAHQVRGTGHGGSDQWWEIRTRQANEQGYDVIGEGNFSNTAWVDAARHLRV